MAHVLNKTRVLLFFLCIVFLHACGQKSESKNDMRTGVAAEEQSRGTEGAGDFHGSCSAESDAWDEELHRV